MNSAKALFAQLGYESATTVAIARQAGTSESQLMKHFGSKEGLLQAIFNLAWQQMNAQLRKALEEYQKPREKLEFLVKLVLGSLDREPEIKLLMLLEGRRIRRKGAMVVLAPGFLEFIRLLDSILKEMRDAGQLRRDLHIEGIRSALMGLCEGLLRDQLLAKRVGYPARYSSKQLREIVNAVLPVLVSPRSR